MEPITVQATINAPIEIVWQMWTLPEHITQWCFASPDWHCPAATNDPRTGGKFSSTMAAKDGSFSFDFGGTYTNVINHKVIELKYQSFKAHQASELLHRSPDSDKRPLIEHY